MDEPEPWQTDAPAPFLTIGEVSVWALGSQRFRVQAPDGEQEVEGFERARTLAHRVALGLDRPS